MKKGLLFFVAAALLFSCTNTEVVEVGNKTSMMVDPVYDAGEVVKGELITAKFKVENTGNFPLVIAGDHASASGTIAGIKDAYPNSRLGVVWIDAHADLHTPYTTPSGNMHGMPLAIALCEDNLVCKSNNVDSETVAIWDRLKNIGFSGPKIKSEDLVFIALRDFEAQESALIDQNAISVIPVDEVTNQGTEHIVKQTLSLLQDCDILYVSFDVDSMDPSLTSLGTGTPVKNGLTPIQAKEILDGLCQDERLVCLEFVEINPCLDEKMNKMAEVAFGLLESVASTIENRK